ncbi:MAG: winged helix-turn-helix transcriptional regulator [Candidatus Eremiobacteraeota bacterium]|nr:winged helix-turn-helix transcriptional regulator [Candidatus Eremiobacteraeota bacterium]MCW5871259.1 winged helix-turn-helix transcriptional regulator [Candidatus Eremiobacteraeota bacterium]
MLESFGKTQQKLLNELNRESEGLTIEELADVLAISGNAVRQHLMALEKSGLVSPGRVMKTRGRPGQSFQLTPRGRELFPRQYSWFAELLLSAIQGEKGSQGLSQLLETLGASVSNAYAAELAALSPESRSQRIAQLMTELGYEAQVEGQEIVASNCVFHHLAERFPEVCQFDLALLQRLSGKPVDHLECMVRGGKVCRFAFGPKSPGQG